jgi:hypothetical protein
MHMRRAGSSAGAPVQAGNSARREPICVPAASVPADSPVAGTTEPVTARAGRATGRIALFDLFEFEDCFSGQFIIF